jgi:hypothetical protein
MYADYQKEISKFAAKKTMKHATQEATLNSSQTNQYFREIIPEIVFSQIHPIIKSGFILFQPQTKRD